VSSGKLINILLLGSGGREDALAWRLRQSPSCGRLLAAPGNPGIARWAKCVALDASSPDDVVALARSANIDLVVVGPEAPLVAGVADACRAANIPVFGPNAAAAELEGSKGFTKDLCAAAGIPTAAYVRANCAEQALAELSRFSLPVVVKADGLAAGKGVTVAETREEAEAAIADIAGAPLVIEEFLRGEEASLFALVDGKTAVPLASAQDHKRVGDGDTGPNTGGMGAYSPARVLTPELQARAMAEIVLPTARAMVAMGRPFSGVLYAGLMLTEEGPKLIEYNVRFGDPECEAIMPRIDGDFAELLLAVATGRLAEIAPPELSDETTMTVVVAADGYPGTPRKGCVIDGIEAAEQAEGVTVFQAGTARHGSGALLAAGGRVLAITARGPTLAEARARAYRAVDAIDFADGFCRRDIGWRELEREGT
jgi:phosphoribosylamine--glycine ligase